MPTLSKGSKGDDVKRVQTLLGLAADGVIGSKTEAAVISWQQAHSISPANGVVGANTYIRMGLVTGTAAALNLAALVGVIPEKILSQVIDDASKFNINSNLRLAHFLAQCAVESGDFKVVEENLNYSASRLLVVFPNKFTEAEAQQYGGKPEKIANRVYANIIGNGNEASGDGWKFRGRGYIQLTGRTNYKAFADFSGIDVVTNPDQVASTYPLASAADYFNRVAKIWPTADQGTSDDTVKAVTKKVNKALLGLSDRTSKFKKYYALLVPAS
ncbi:MAG: peptidoglycan-binding protein [Bacteroidia bacterium]